MATVFSQCEPRAPSRLTTVHSASSSRVWCVPRVSMGSMANAMPPSSRAVGRGRYQFGTSGSMCISEPMPWPV